MKKFLTLNLVVKAAGVLFALVAFFLMFAPQMMYIVGSNTEYYTIGQATAGWEGLIGDAKGTALGLIGYILVILGAVGACVLVFLKLDAKIKMFAGLGAALLVLLGGIFVFCLAASFNAVNETEGFRLAGGAIVAGILALVGALAMAASEFLPGKPLVK